LARAKKKKRKGKKLPQTEEDGETSATTARASIVDANSGAKRWMKMVASELLTAKVIASYFVFSLSTI